MARTTDTRAQVRALADQLHAAGTIPTPTVIREMLGTGSPNTIVDELRKWSQQKNSGAAKSKPLSEPSNSTAQALERVGASEASELIRKAALVASELAATVAPLEALASALSGMPRRFDELVKQVEDHLAKQDSDRKWMQAELDKAYQRYEAVQRHTLMQISAARDETAELRAKLKEMDSGTYSRELAYKRQTDELRTLAIRLQGRLQEQGKSLVGLELPPALG